MKGKYLKQLFDEEYLDIDDVCDLGEFYVIKAGTGSGKTTFAIDVIAKEFGPKKTLYLIDTTKGKKQLLQKDECVDIYFEEMVFGHEDYFEMTSKEFEDWLASKITVMTYAQFGYYCRKISGFAERYSCIICDEIHNLIDFVRWDDAKGLNDNTVSNNHMALDMISYCVFQEKAYVICLSATPQKFIDFFATEAERETGEVGYIHIVDIAEEIRHYETATTRTYSNLHLLLSQLPADARGLIYVSHITQMEKHIDYLRSRGINAAGIWSENNENHPMNEEQRAINEYVISKGEIPDDVQVLFINRSCETSINIYTRLDYVVVHSSEEDVQIQARGRYRGDLEILYVYDECGEDELIIDDKWLNRPLTKEDKSALCEELGFKVNGKLQKWPSVKSMLEAYGDYRIEEKKSGSKRYTIILGQNG